MSSVHDLMLDNIIKIYYANSFDTSDAVNSLMTPFGTFVLYTIYKYIRSEEK